MYPSHLTPDKLQKTSDEISYYKPCRNFSRFGVFLSISVNSD